MLVLFLLFFLDFPLDDLQLLLLLQGLLVEPIEDAVGIRLVGNPTVYILFGS